MDITIPLVGKLDSHFLTQYYSGHKSEHLPPFENTLVVVLNLIKIVFEQKPGEWQEETIAWMEGFRPN
jgi:hypothetical protein